MALMGLEGGVRWREWLERVRGKPVEATQSLRMRDDNRLKVPRRRIANAWNHLISAMAELWRRIRRLRVWITAGLVIALYLLFWFRLYQAAPSETQIFHWSFWDDKPEDARNLVLAVGGWLGVLAASVGLVFAGFRASTELQMARIAEDGQVTERFTRAVEHLGHDNRAVRLGAIYALERIARDSARDRDTILETLAAYIREHAPWPPRGEDGRRLIGEALTAKLEFHQPRLAIDMDAALTVICRLLPAGDPMRKKIDLRDTDLRGLDAPEIDLSGMRLSQARLAGADLTEANLARADLTKANLSGVVLSRANLDYAALTDTDLRQADLTGAVLTDATLSHAQLDWATLIGADLGGANLAGAVLYNAKLENANLRGADLSWRAAGLHPDPPSHSHGNVSLCAANLRNANLRDANLWFANLCDAILCDADLNGAKLDYAAVSGADFNGVLNLTQPQLNQVRYDANNPPRNLPADLTLPEPFQGPC